MAIDLGLGKELLEVQNLAMKVAEETFKVLEVGMTEKDAVEILDSKAKSQSITKYFHHPFAWFGERTMFKDFTQPLPLLTKSTWRQLRVPKSIKALPHFGIEFMPSDTQLINNMPVILDLAPMKNGVFSDIGYSQYFGESPEHEAMIHFLIKLRIAIPELIRHEKDISKIYRSIDDMIADNGFVNCHQKYPLGVLGHKVGKYPDIKIPLPKINIMGFPPEAFIFLMAQNLTAPFYYSNKTPYLAGHINQKISDGYWAIEPHIGLNNMGAKFEEILVIDGNNINWLNA